MGDETTWRVSIQAGRVPLKDFRGTRCSYLANKQGDKLANKFTFLGNSHCRISGQNRRTNKLGDKFTLPDTNRWDNRQSEQGHNLGDWKASLPCSLQNFRKKWFSIISKIPTNPYSFQLFRTKSNEHPHQQTIGLQETRKLNNFIGNSAWNYVGEHVANSGRESFREMLSRIWLERGCGLHPECLGRQLDLGMAM